MTKITDALNAYAESAVGGRSKLLDDSYFYDFRQNIYKGEMASEFMEMFLKGDGNELAAKACAVHSSSMLGYNFFHWLKDKPVTIEWIEGATCYDKVFFEVKMRVLNGRSNPANMDIVLTNEKGDCLFIESKFLEYTRTDGFKIADAYTDASRYMFKDDILANGWSKYVSSLVRRDGSNHLDISNKNQYWGGIKQEISHMIALTNWVRGFGIGEKNDWPYCGGETRFINLVFDPKQEYDEYSAFINYNKRYEELYKDLKDKRLISKDVITGFMSYSQIWSMMKEQMTPDLRKYLWNHYMKYSNADY